MNQIHLNKIAELEQQYIHDDGIGQFSWYRFACAIIKDEPALAEAIVAEALKQIGHQVHIPPSQSSGDSSSFEEAGPWGEPLEVTVPQGGNARSRKAYTARCPECYQTVIEQSMDACPSCYRAIVWANSLIAEARYRQQKNANIDKQIREKGPPHYSIEPIVKMGFSVDVAKAAASIANGLSLKAYKTSGFGKRLENEQLRLIALKLDKKVYTCEHLLAWIEQSTDIGKRLVDHFLNFISGDFQGPALAEEAGAAIIEKW